MKHSNLLNGVALLLIATIAWGAMFPITKVALTILDGFYISLLRYGIASLIFLLILFVLEGKQSFSFESKFKTVFWRGSCGFAGFSILAFVGLSYSTPVHAAILMALMPLITVVANWYRSGNCPSKVTLSCILLALIGVCLVITKGHVSTLTSNITSVCGDLLIFIGAVCWVVYTLGANEVPHWSAVRYTAISAMLGTITILLATVIATATGYVHVPTLQAILSVKFSLLYLIIVAGVIAVFSWNNGIKKLGALNGVLFINLVPITAFFISIVQNQTVSVTELLGASMTILALVINNLHTRRNIKI